MLYKWLSVPFVSNLKHPPPNRGKWLRGSDQNIIRQERLLKWGWGKRCVPSLHRLLGIPQHSASPWSAWFLCAPAHTLHFDLTRLHGEYRPPTAPPPWPIHHSPRAPVPSWPVDLSSDLNHSPTWPLSPAPCRQEEWVGGASQEGPLSS